MKTKNDMDRIREGQKERISGILYPISKYLREHGIEGQELEDIVNDLVQVGFDYELMDQQHRESYVEAVMYGMMSSIDVKRFELGKFSKQSYLEEMPQVNIKTGISGDYWGEYATSILIFIDSNEFPAFDIAESFRKSPVKKYEERFPPKEYKNVVTNKNKVRVDKLNKLAKLVNKKFIDESKFTELDYGNLITKVHNLIHGTKISYYRKVLLPQMNK